MGTALQHHARGAHFGEFLRGARERRGLTIRDISNETKIPWRHLDAFEHGDLTVVPNRMYRRAEVRAYARAVGLDQNLALEELEQATDGSNIERSETESILAVRGAEQPRHRVPATVATVIVAAILLVAVQVWNSRSAPPAIAPTPAASAPPAESAPPTTDAASPPPSVPAPAVVVPNSAVASAEAVSSPEPITSDQAIPAPPSADNALVVTSDPPGARVMVDGIGRGATPVTIRLLTPGEKTIRVIKDGFASEERTIRVTTGKATVHVPLRSSAN
jgi:cytoskeleton protein RodZ